MFNLKIVKQSPRMISDGICVTKDAYIVIDKKVPNSIAQWVIHYASQNLIRVETARLEQR